MMGRGFVLAGVVLYCSFSWAQSRDPDRVLDQDVHVKIHFHEVWRGAYLRTRLSHSLGRVRFDYCGSEKYRECQMISQEEIPIERLPKHQTKLLEGLHEMRDSLEKLRAGGRMSGLRNYLADIAGTERAEENLCAIKSLINKIETKGLGNLMLLTEHDVTPRSNRGVCHFTSPAVADRVAQVFSEALNSPPEEIIRQTAYRIPRPASGQGAR